jgi:hypothetical protein
MGAVRWENGPYDLRDVDQMAPVDWHMCMRM